MSLRFILGGIVVGTLAAGCGEAEVPQKAPPAVKITTVPRPRTVSQTRSCEDRQQTVTVEDSGDNPHKVAGLKAYSLLARHWLDAGKASAAWRCVQEAVPEAGLDPDGPELAPAYAHLNAGRVAEAAEAGIMEISAQAH